MLLESMPIPMEGRVREPAATINVLVQAYISQFRLDHSVRRSSSLDWKKDRNRTGPNHKRPDHRLRLHKF